MIVCTVTCAWAADKADGAETASFSDAASALAKWRESAGPTPSQSLDAAVQALKALKEIPKLHSDAYVARAAAGPEKERMAAEAAALKTVFTTIARMSRVLTKATDEELASCLGRIVELKERLAEPVGYGNSFAQIDLSAYVSRMAMVRLFKSPKAAVILQPVLARNATHSIPDWGRLASVLADESGGAIRLSLTEQTPLGDRLMEILRAPPGFGEKVNEKAKTAESVNAYVHEIGPYDTSQGVTAGMEARLHLEKMSLPGLALGIAMTQYLVEGSCWWADTLKKTPSIPASLKDLEMAVEEKALTLPSQVIVISGKPFTAEDLYGLIRQRGMLAQQATVFLAPLPIPNSSVPPIEQTEQGRDVPKKNVSQ
jgi:hypothetical protein